MENQQKSHLLSWVALSVSVAALIVAGMAFGRSGENIISETENSADRARTQTQTETIEIRNEVRQQVALAEARARLGYLEARLGAGLAGDSASREVSDARKELSDAYKDARGEALDNWKKIDDALAQLEIKMKNNASDAGSALKDAINELKTSTNP